MIKSKLIVPNTLCVLRMVLAIILTSLILKWVNSSIKVSATGVLLSLFGVIYLTDYLDGKIARYYEAVTRIGGVLDLLADFICILMTSFALSIKNILPAWFIGVIIIKFIEFLVTSSILRKVEKNENVGFVFDLTGRIGACLMYLIPCVCCLFYIQNPYLIKIVLAITTVLCFISFIYRVIRSIRVLKSGGFSKYKVNNKSAEARELYR